jgi:hypothetical protein
MTFILVSVFIVLAPVHFLCRFRSEQIFISNSATELGHLSRDAYIMVAGMRHFLELSLQCSKSVITSGSVTPEPG